MPKTRASLRAAEVPSAGARSKNKAFQFPVRLNTCRPNVARPTFRDYSEGKRHDLSSQSDSVVCFRRHRGACGRHHRVCTGLSEPSRHRRRAVHSGGKHRHSRAHARAETGAASGQDVPGRKPPGCRHADRGQRGRQGRTGRLHPPDGTEFDNGGQRHGRLSH